MNSINWQKEEREMEMMTGTLNSEVGGTDPITPPLPHFILSIPPACT